MDNLALINDVAQLFRVSSGTIRFYERKNIISPTRGSDNSYRYFTQDDIRRLSSCRIFQSLGFSLSEIEEIFQASSDDDLNERLERKKDELHKIIQETTEALECIQRLDSAKEQFDAHCGQFFIQNSPHLMFSYHSEWDTINRECIKSNFWDCLASNYNLFYCSTLISPSIAEDPCLDEKMKRGYSICYDDGIRLGLHPDATIFDLPPRRCVYTMFHAEPIVSYQHLAPAYTWMKQCGFKLSGNIICRTVKVSFNQGVDSRYYEVWIPID